VVEDQEYLIDAFPKFSFPILLFSLSIQHSFPSFRTRALSSIHIFSQSFKVFSPSKMQFFAILVIALTAATREQDQIHHQYGLHH
jgi:hypothetical protein